MRKILFKFLILSCLIVVISETIWNRLDLPFYWGNVQLNTKMDFLKEQEQSFNTYFLGSSVTFRQVMPSVFDSIVGNDMNSFNLAIDGGFAPHTFKILEEIIEEPTIKYVFFELNSYDFFGQNFRKTDSKYYLTLRRLGQVLSYIWYSSMSLFHKVAVSGMYAYSYIEKSLGLGMRENYLKEISVKNKFGGTVLMGKKLDGYYALPGEHTKDQTIRAEIPKLMEKLKKEYTSAFEVSKSSTLAYNSAMYHQLMYYIDLAKAKNIRLIYYLQPTPYALDTPSAMLGLYQQLPEEHKLSVAEPVSFSDFYQEQYRWDSGHLNQKGARIFSKELALAFKKII